MSSTIEEVAAEPWATIAAEWRQRDDTRLLDLVTGGPSPATDHIGALRDTELFRTEVAGLPVGQRGGRAGDPDPGGGALTHAVLALFDLDRGRGHAASVAALVYLQALVIWEESDDLRQMRALAVALDRATTLRPAPPDEADLVAAAAEMCWSLLEQVAVENGVFCSCPIAAAEHSERTLQAVTRAEARLAQIPADPDLAGARFVLAEDLRVTRRYFSQLVSVSDAASLWIDDPGGSVSVLTEAIDAAEAGVEALEPDVFASELHTHQVALEHMRAAARRPQLHLGEGTIVYLYPFGLPAQASGDLVTGLLDGSRRRPDNLGGLRVEGLKAVTVAGGWQQESCLGMPNKAVLLTLPELEIETTAATPGPGSPRALPPEYTVITGLRPQVRLSALGNHVLRIEGRMEDVELHSLDQAMRRIGRASGREILRTASGQPVPGGYLCDVADRIVADLQSFLSQEAVAGESGGHGLTAVRELDLLSTAHVVLSARALEVHDGDEVRACRAGEVSEILGASIVLGAPRSSAGSFEWWIAQEVGPVVNVLEGKGRGDALMARTLASTIVYAPDLADWQTTELDQMAEHVASVSGALQAWGDHLGHYEQLVANDLDEVEETGDSNAIRDRLRQLAHDASRARSMLGQLRPVNLCRNAADRAVVEALQAEAGISVVEHAVHDGLEVLGAQQGRLAAEAERMRADVERAEGQRQERVQRRLDLWLAVISVVGLTSLADFLNSAHNVEGARVPWIEFAFIVLVVLTTLLLYIWRWRVAGEVRRDRGRAGDPPP